MAVCVTRLKTDQRQNLLRIVLVCFYIYQIKKPKTLIKHEGHFRTWGIIIIILCCVTEIETCETKFLLQAESKEDMDGWIKALRKTVVGYSNVYIKHTST